MPRSSPCKTAITHFIFCREDIQPTDYKYGAFLQGDAVFFSGEPEYGTSTACDSYEKKGMVVVYFNPDNNVTEPAQQFWEIGEYKMSNGSQAIDVVCISYAYYATQEYPYLKEFTNNLQAIFSSGSIKHLQDKGIAVLLTIQNTNSIAGWSQFSSDEEALAFAGSLKAQVVDQYHLNGIDIDDEYSKGTVHTDSLATVTYMLRRLMPEKIISKCLFDDSEYFNATYQGKTLAQNLTYGWGMSYGASPESLSKYLTYGMKNNQLSWGFWAYQPSDNPQQNIEWLKANKDEGFMVLGFEDKKNIFMTGELVDDWYGANSWNPPAC